MTMDFYPKVHSPQLAAIQAQLDRIEAKINVLGLQGASMALDLSALTQEVQENGDVGQSAIALLNGLSQQIRDSAADPAALQQLADQLDSQSNELAQAVAANTVADPDAPHPDHTLPGDLPGGGGEEGGAGAPV